MENLLQLVKGYLESQEFRVIEERSDALVADKLLFQERDTIIVWVIPDGQTITHYAPSLRGSIASLRGSYPDAKGFLLARSTAGFSRDMRETLTDSRIQLRAPIQFFDTAFKHEESPSHASIVKNLQSLGRSQKRIAQPYNVDGHAANDSGVDLLEILAGGIPEPQRARVRIIVGRAGVGKSVLFRSLYAKLYDEFHAAKSKLGIRPRPIPFVPEYLRGAYAVRVPVLIDSFLRTDVATPVEPRTFEWLLVHGFTSWFFDGLDELYSGDPQFFETLLELITRPESSAQITIFCRDSMLTASDQFDEFREMCSTGPDLLEVYRLSEWERPSKRQYAWLSIEDRPPRTAEADTPIVAGFLKELDSSPALRSLSGLPFYCQVLLDLYRDGQLRDFADDAVLLNYVVDKMIAREIDKGVIDKSYFESNGLNEWLEGIAVTFIEDRRYSDIPRSDATGLGELVLRPSLDDETKKNVLLSLLQFPLFQAGSESGLITFSHELIAEALAARSYLQTLRRKPADVAHRLSRIDLQDPSLLRFIAHGVDAEAENQLTNELTGGASAGRGFAVLLTLLMLSRPARDLLKRFRVNLEGRDLSGVRFLKRDLSGMSFRGADLSNTVFNDCDLTSARLEGTFLKQTRFEGENRLQDAHFGDLARVYSVWWKGRLVEDSAKLRDWVGRSTGRALPSTEPCAAGLQILQLFGKFITPLGTPRRDSLVRQGLLAGKRHSGAPTSQECVDAAVRHGYLVGPDFRDRFRRAEGDKYAEMVTLCAESKVSDGIGVMISELCARNGCLHQLRTL